MLRFLILFVQRMFCNGKKNYTYGKHSKLRKGHKKLFYFLFFSVLIVIVDVSLFREGDMFVFLYEMEKKKLLLFDKKKDL